MKDVLETIEHVTWEGDNRVTYHVQINYGDTDIAGTLEIVEVNGLNADFLTSAFIEILKEEIIEDVEAERVEAAKRTGGLIYGRYLND